MQPYRRWVSLKKIKQAPTVWSGVLFLVIYVTLSHSSPKYIQECQVLDSQQYNAALHVPDYSIIVEADGNESGKKQLKTMTWPVMDDDALPSSYITKVLTCLSKWSVKMDSLLEVLLSLDEQQPVAKPSFVRTIISLKSGSNYNDLEFQLCATMFLRFRFKFRVQLRLTDRASDLKLTLGTLSDKITQLNMRCITDGFKMKNLGHKFLKNGIDTWFKLNTQLEVEALSIQPSWPTKYSGFCSCYSHSGTKMI